MKNQVEVTIGTKNSSAENISHVYYSIHAKDKYKVLKRVADSEPGIYAIVFCRTRRETQEIASKLINDGYNADALHGDLSQLQRDNVMQKFRTGNIRLLVATDVAARGLDVDDLTHVINFSLPDDPEIYTHRCGRTGRAGKSGISVSLVHLKERHNLQKIEKLIKKSFKAESVPTGTQICEKQLLNWLGKLETIKTDHREIEKFLPEINDKLSGMDREELVKRIVSLEFNRILDDYRHDEKLIDAFPEENNSPDIRMSRKKSRQKHTGNYNRLFINLGKSDGFYPEQLIDLVNTNTIGRKIPIGKIDLLKTFSFFEVENRYAYDLIGALNNQKFLDRRIMVEIAREKTDKEVYPEYSEITTAGKSIGKKGKRMKKKRQRSVYKN
jgi:ATP-dependent RNA helicase DeaD